MEPLLEDQNDFALHTKGLGSWAGTWVGTLVGVLAGVVGLAIEFLDLNFGPPPDYDFLVPTAWGPVGAFGGVVAGAIAGTIGLWIGQRVTAKAGNAISGLVGGAIGAAIGAIAPVCWLIAGDYYSDTQTLGGAFMSMIIPLLVVGAIIGAICGLVVAIYGMRNQSAIPMIAFLGFFAGLDLGGLSRLWHGYLGLGLSVVIWSGVTMMNARRGTAMGAQLSHAARNGAFGAGIGGVTGTFIVMIVVASTQFLTT